MIKETVYRVGEAEFTDCNKAIKYEADLYGEALKSAGFVCVGLARRVNDAEEFLTFKETGKLPEVKAKKPKEETPAE